jgi:hypothetical protein
MAEMGHIEKRIHVHIWKILNNHLINNQYFKEINVSFGLWMHTMHTTKEIKATT